MTPGNGHKRRGLTPEFYRSKLVERLRAEGIRSQAVLEAMGRVPRHLFVEEAWDLKKAYEDTALPIGHGQTISQPYVVARMTEELLAGEGSVRSVLEVGTGCGYQAAVLAELVERVYSVERIKALYDQTRERLRQLSCFRVHLMHGDGRLGWARQAPFDAVIVTAAGAEVPRDLLTQLRVGGRLIMPVGQPGHQDLVCLTKHADRTERQNLAAVTFVPLLTDTVD